MFYCEEFPQCLVSSAPQPSFVPEFPAPSSQSFCRLPIAIFPAVLEVSPVSLLRLEVSLLDREALFTDRFCTFKQPTCVMPTTKILPSNKSSLRRLNTGSALTSRQEATPASAEVGPSTSSTPSVSLRGDAESAEVSSSLIGQPIMDTHGIVVPPQPILVEPRINKRRDRSPSETSDGRAEIPKETPLLIEETPLQTEETPLQSEETPLHSEETPLIAIEEIPPIKNPQWIS